VGRIVEAALGQPLRTRRTAQWNSVPQRKPAPASTSTPTTQLIIAWASSTAVDPELLDVDVSIEAADIDAAHDRAQADGPQIVRELRDEPWGIRRYFLRDPAGRRSTSPVTSSPAPDTLRQGSAEARHLNAWLGTVGAARRHRRLRGARQALR
jgi:catechol 2,3-dioxygenase-like lactoylglutathione lyase family enzyme